MSEKVTARGIVAKKARGERIVCITAYDSAFGRLADEAGVDVILVGDSVGNVMLGYESTLRVTLDQMVHHTKATRAGVKRALLVADLPFGSYQSSVAQAVDSAVELVQAGAEAVKLEGSYSEAIMAIRRAGIPVMGHVGMTPQSLNEFGGFRVQGRGDQADAVKQEAMKVDEAGAFAIVLELMPRGLAGQITAMVRAATIGIGAGIQCDGEIQVLHDVLGLSDSNLKHAKVYVSGANLVKNALTEYAAEVRAGSFPTEDHSF